jgi:hypothetical protein
MIHLLRSKLIHCLRRPLAWLNSATTQNPLGISGAALLRLTGQPRRLSPHEHPGKSIRSSALIRFRESLLLFTGAVNVSDNVEVFVELNAGAQGAARSTSGG